MRLSVKLLLIITPLLLLIITIMHIVSGNVAAKTANQYDFYTYEQMQEEIHLLELRYPELVSVHELAQTQEGRKVILLEIGHKTGNDKKLGLLATFAQHSDEHETTKIAMGFIKRLLENYGTDEEITKTLNESTAYIIPMANPDGVDYDLSSDKTFTTWRKNRAPTGENNYGVDLNRNWDCYWDVPTATDLDRSINDSKDSYYHGRCPFSEVETKSISNFILSHKNINIFVDYHTGSANFIQGDILIPFCYTKEQKLAPEVLARYEAISSNLCRLITDANDKRTPYAAMQAYKIREYVLQQAPLWQRVFIKPFMPASTLAPGAAIDWAASQGLLALGIEVACSNGSVEESAASRENLIEHQFNGFLYLLSHLQKE